VAIQKRDNTKWSAKEGPAEDVYWRSALHVLYYDNNGD